MTSGWPFLVARGRRHGHRARLVPEVLTGLGASGVVEELAGARSDPATGPVQLQVPLPDRNLTVVYQTHRIRPEDLADPARAARDEHGRPLDIIYGFVCLDGMIQPLDDADLRTAQRQAVLSYRRFLDDESGYVTQTSPSFQLRSGVVPFRPPAVAAGARPSPARPVRVRIAVLTVGAVAVLAAAAGAVLALVPEPVVDLAGTWAGLDELGAGRVTVTITCTPGCAEPPATTIGNVGYGGCGYTLALDRTADGVIHADARRVSGTDCLPDGRVSLRREDDKTASLHWNNPATDTPLLRAPALRRVGD